jgi:hypothetical protein
MLRSSLTGRGLFLFLLVIGGSFLVALQVYKSAAQTQSPFEANDRLEIPAIHNTLRVAEPNEIPIVIRGSELKKIVSVHRPVEGPTYDTSGAQTLEILHHVNGSTYVNIVPIYFGELTIRFMATFTDGGFAVTNITVNVGPSKVAPAALGLAPRPSPNGLFINRKIQTPSYLKPVAYYYGLRSPISVPPQFATFDLTTVGNPPVIQIDPATGKVTPLRTGDALLETRYAGVAMHTCIQVRDNEDYYADVSNRAFCKGLRHLDELAASAPLSQTWAVDPSGSHTFFADIYFFAERLSVTAPDRPVGLGQPVQIPVRLSGEKVKYIVFRQWIYNNGRSIAIPVNARDANGVSLGETESVPGQKRVDPLKGNGETGKFLEIVPLALGNVEVGIGVYFEDGGFTERFFRMKVVPSSQGLKFFHNPIAYGPLRPPEDQSENSEFPHAIQLGANVGYAGIYTGSSYGGVQDAIQLYSLEGVMFSIQQAPGPPVIKVDEKGWVQALHSGDAVVIADFAGRKWQYPIHVLATQTR